MSDLDPRKRIILRAVVIEHVAEAEPVSSEQIAQKYNLGVRGATVRNELAEMSELGYLEQPHTSAGRVPSDTGYRFYVDHLVSEAPIDPTNKQRVQEVAAKSEALKALLQDTTKVLSRMTRQLSAATTLGDIELRATSALITALGPQRGLLVLVLNNGDVENRMLECPLETSLEDLGRLNEFLSKTVANVSLRSLSRVKNPAASGRTPYDKLTGLVMGQIRSIARDRMKAGLVVEGEEYMLAQPELRRDANLLIEVMEALENEEGLAHAVANPGESPLSVTIGKEHGANGLQHLSIVRHSFYIGEEEAGTLAIIGPTRLNYDEAISMLTLTAKAISASLSRLLS